MKGFRVIMKKSSWIFFLSFFVGILGVNLWCKDSMVLWDISRYGNTGIVTGQMSAERYFCCIFLMRSRILVCLMLAERALPTGIAVNGLCCILFAMFGGLVSIATVTGGIGGIFEILLFLFPQWIFYGLAFYLWRKKRLSGERTVGYSYRMRKQLTETISGSLYWWIVFVVFLLGMIAEGFIQPFFLEKVIKW